MLIAREAPEPGHCIAPAIDRGDLPVMTTAQSVKNVLQRHLNPPLTKRTVQYGWWHGRCWTGVWGATSNARVGVNIAARLAATCLTAWHPCLIALAVLFQAAGLTAPAPLFVLAVAVQLGLKRGRATSQDLDLSLLDLLLMAGCVVAVDAGTVWSTKPAGCKAFTVEFEAQ